MQPERRQLLRAGIWSLPVIAVATSAPAFATSGSDLSTSVVTVTSPQKPIFVTATIINSGSGPTTRITVTVTSPNAVSTTQVAPNGNWTVLVTATNTVVFTYTGPPLAAGAALPQTTFVVDRGNNASGNVTVVIDPGGSGSSKSQAYPI